MHPLLILGGTTEASRLAKLLAGDARFRPMLSLAGRTASPAPQPLAVRVGGFGGVDGLTRWLEAERIAAVIDATHPYAAVISANAVAACARLGVPLASLVRPAWTEVSGDRWRHAESAEAASGLLATETRPLRIFLSVGRMELAAFAAAPQHDYLARTIDAPEGGPLPSRIRFVLARGPFDTAAEAALLAQERIDLVVSKNSGGAATYGKIEAAREAGLPVLMLRRPAKPHGEIMGSPEEAVRWLAGIAAHGRRPPSARAV